MIHQTPHFFDKTWKRLRAVWHNVAGSNDEHSILSFRPDLPDDDLQLLREHMQRCLKPHGGEVLARAETAALGQAYLELTEEGRSRFLKVLATDFDVDLEQLEQVIKSWQPSDTEDERYTKIQQLRQALATPRMKLLTQFNELPEGVKFLVDMRADLMTLSANDKTMSALEVDLKRLLVSWFDIGFLSLEHITWNSPASLLEKLIAYEAVHQIRSWDDLKNRLDSDRRCYAFLHPHMPGEPLIFVEVALTTGLATNVQNLLDETAPLQDLDQADTAIFYSISNAQQGLAGISFGNFLIKRVVNKLAEEFPGLKHFATLSPIVKFRRWLEADLVNNEADLLTSTEQTIVTTQCERLGLKTQLASLLAYPNWEQDNEICEVLQPILTRLAAYYLVQEKHRDNRAFDPVARFHLTNGAQIEQLNWMADTSEKGIKQSYGLMVNYLYQLDRIEANSAAYTLHGEVATSSVIMNLLKK